MTASTVERLDEVVQRLHDAADVVSARLLAPPIGDEADAPHAERFGTRPVRVDESSDWCAYQRCVTEVLVMARRLAADQAALLRAGEWLCALVPSDNKDSSGHSPARLRWRSVVGTVSQW